MGSSVEAVHGTRAGAISVRGVSKSFPTRGARSEDRLLLALRETSFDIQPGEFVSIVGPSGCGKTTILRMIAGLTPVDNGQIVVSDVEVRGPGRDRAVVFQQPALLPWASVLDNVAFGLRIRGVAQQQRRDTARDLVRLVGLEGFEQHLPGELSGGMQQRVGLARALAVGPEILLLDEPFASLDEITRRQMQDELLRIWGSTRVTSLLITHSVDEALLLSDRVLIMAGRPGMLVENLVVDIPRPRTREVEATAEFLVLKQRIWRHLGSSEVDDV